MYIFGKIDGFGIFWNFDLILRENFDMGPFFLNFFLLITDRNITY